MRESQYHDPAHAGRAEKNSMRRNGAHRRIRPVPRAPCAALAELEAMKAYVKGAYDQQRNSCPWRWKTQMAISYVPAEWGDKIVVMDFGLLGANPDIMAFPGQNAA